MITVKETFEDLPTLLKWSHEQCHLQGNLDSYIEQSTRLFTELGSRIFSFRIDDVLVGCIVCNQCVSVHHGSFMSVQTLIDVPYHFNRPLLRELSKQIRLVCEEHELSVYSTCKHDGLFREIISYHYL